MPSPGTVADMTSAAASLKERVVSNLLEADFWVTMWNKLTEPDFLGGSVGQTH